MNDLPIHNKCQIVLKIFELYLYRSKSFIKFVYIKGGGFNNNDRYKFSNTSRLACSVTFHNTSFYIPIIALWERQKNNKFPHLITWTIFDILRPRIIAPFCGKKYCLWSAIDREKTWSETKIIYKTISSVILHTLLRNPFPFATIKSTFYFSLLLE